MRHWHLWLSAGIMVGGIVAAATIVTSTPPPASCDCAEVCARATDGVTAAARERLDLLVESMRRIELRLIQMDVFVRGPGR